MNILLTGGTGFIGQALCRQLLAQGHSLTLLSRNPAKAAALFGAAVATVDTLAALRPEQHFQAVVNLAGEPILGARWTPRRKQQLLDSRVGLTQQLLAFMARAEQKPAVLLSGSAAGWYGDQGDAPLDESSPCRTPDFGHELCRRWEEAALEAEGLGVRVCLLRTGLVVGKHGGFLARMLPLFRLGLGGSLGDGRQWMPWIHLHDHIAITTLLLEDAALAGAFNLCAPHPATNAEFSRALAAVLHRPACLPLPAWLLRAAMGEMAGLLLGGQHALPQRILQAGYQFQFPQLEEALRQVV